MNELAELHRRVAELEKSEIELKRAEEERIKAEELLRRTLDNVLIGCMIIGFDWTYLYVNDVAARHGHQNRENLIGRTMIEIYPDVEKSAIFAAYRQCMEKRVYQRVESEFIFPDGTSNYYDISAEPVPEGIFVLSIDITERKRAEGALKKSEVLLNETQHLTKSGGWEFNVNTSNMTWTEETYRIYGVSPQDYDPNDVRKDIDFYAPEERPIIESAFRRAVEDGESYDLELKFRNARQEDIWVRTIGKAERKNGRIVRLFGNIMDVTERKQMEETLKESEERYRMIIEFSNDMIWILDTEGRYEFVNKRIEEFSGLKLDYFIGKSFIPFIDRQDLPNVINCFHRTLKGEPQQYEVSVRKIDGTDIILSVNTAPFFSKGKIVGTVSFGRDITERKKADEKIKESLEQKLKKSNKQRKLLCYLIEGTRGGKTRALILRHLTEKSHNAHQLAKALNMDYKTIRHHLKVLERKGIITKGKDEYSGLYFIVKNIEPDLDEMDIFQ